jgi:hypothetical protein
MGRDGQMFLTRYKSLTLKLLYVKGFRQLCESHELKSGASLEKSR